MGRTQLQDAVPMTLGQTFHGFASILRNELPHLDAAAAEFLVINMGATAIGTGICAEPNYAEMSTAEIAAITGYAYRLSDDLVGATSDTSCMAGYSGAMRMVALKMNKICNDLRLISSGPRCGGRNHATGCATGFFNYAGQDQSGYPRGDESDCLQGDWQRPLRKYEFGSCANGA